MDKRAVLQETILNTLRKNRTPATVFLTNGFQIKGTVRSYDDFTVLLESDKTQQLVYKHAISTIIPTTYIMIENG